MLISMYSLRGGKPHYGKPSKTQQDINVSSNCLHKLQSPQTGTSWNRLELKHSQSGLSFQCNLPSSESDLHS